MRGGIRTPNLPNRTRPLCPVELRARGAFRRNRTHVSSLQRICSATELERRWCTEMDLNHRPVKYKLIALTTELPVREKKNWQVCSESN